MDFSLVKRLLGINSLFSGFPPGKLPVRGSIPKLLLANVPNICPAITLQSSFNKSFPPLYRKSLPTEVYYGPNIIPPHYILFGFMSLVTAGLASNYVNETMLQNN